MINKDAERILKCEDLTAEIQRIWNVRTKVIPVITGAAGTISKSFRKHLSNITGNTNSRNYIKQPYWHWHTYCGKC